MPIYVKPQISFHEGGGRVNVMVGPKNNMAKQIEAVIVSIPFPRVISSANLTANVGSVQYDEQAKVALRSPLYYLPPPRFLSQS